jgi:DNA mismatch endonuclease (patch repair protein)
MRKRQKEVMSPRFTGTPSSATASKIKQRTRGRDTRPELLLRRALWARGLRYRVDVRTLPGRPDLVFTRARIVVFCDGDFWHGKNWRNRRTKLARGTNSAYWIAKITANIVRDRSTTARLAAAGWRVLRFWESEIRDDLQDIVDRICVLLQQPPI